MQRGRFIRHEARGDLEPRAYATEYRESVAADA